MKEIIKRYWRFLVFPAAILTVSWMCLLTLVYSPGSAGQVVEAGRVLIPLFESNDYAVMLLAGCCSVVLTQLQVIVLLIVMFIDWLSEKAIERINKIIK